MKKSLWIVLLAYAAFAACTKDPKEPDNTDPDAVVFMASAEAVSGAGSTDGIDYVWEADKDRIGLFATADGTQDYANVYYAAFSSTAESRFIGLAEENVIRWNGGTTVRSFAAYYPFRTSYKDPTAIPVSVAAEQSGAVNSTAHLKAATVMYASKENALRKDGDVALTFKSFCAIVRLRIASTETVAGISSVIIRSVDGETMAFGEGTLNLGNGSVTPNAGTVSDRVQFSFADPVAFSGTPSDVYVSVYPGHAGKELEVSAVTAKGTVVLETVTVPQAGLTAGMLATLTIGYEAPVPVIVDLSAGGTANTYLVNKAGQTYKFNAAVKGNGEARTYEWESDGTALSGSYSDLAIEPENAALVWYNSPKSAAGWVSLSPVETESVELNEDGYIYFNTPGEFVPGNALIAALDDSGGVLWSWNIWAVEDYDYDTAAKTVGQYKMMDRNLGAVKGGEARNISDPREAAWAIGNYYQWGRKDPFPAAADYTGANIGTSGRPMEWGLPTYTPVDVLKQDCSSESWGADNMMFSYNYANNSYGLSGAFGNAFTIDQAVESSAKLPYKWMSSGADNNSVSPYMWMVQNDNVQQNEKGAWRYLWGNVSGVDGLKSIYDPCPPGWMVPDAAAMGLVLSRLTVASNNYGLYSSAYDLYFPSAGQRQAAFGGSRIGEIQSSGTLYMQTSSSTSDSNRALRASTYVADGAATGSPVTNYNSYAGAGYQVRCVREETSAVPVAGGNLGGPRAVLMGDSITEGWYNTEERKAYLNENNYIGKGISGQTSYNMIERFNTAVIAYDPVCVFIGAGTNDIAENGGYVALEDIAANVRIMAEWAWSYGSEVVIGSVPPARKFGWKDAAWNASHDVAGSIIKLNAMLKEYAESRGFQYADVHTALKADDGGMKPEYTYDEVHLTDEGYRVMMPILKAAVDAALYNPDETNTGGGQLDDLEKWEGWD